MPALAFLGGTVSVLAVMAGSAVWSGYVLTVLWAWFIVPTFHLPALTLAPAIGIALIVRFMTYVHMEDDDIPFGEVISKTVLYATLYPLFSLMMGWIVHSFT